MPAFIRTKADEAKWAKAKEAANKSHSESEGDSYWAIVNSIYQKMAKAKEELEKARPKMSDEYDPNEVPEESDDLGEGFREFDPDEESAGEDWLKENDPESQGGDGYEEYADDEDPEAHQRSIEEDLGDDNQGVEVAQPTGDPARPKTKNFFDKEDAKQVAQAPDLETAKQKALELIAKQPGARGHNIDAATKAVQNAASPRQLSTLMQNFTAQYEAAKAKKPSRFAQPSREELMALRQYTRPWEQRAREAQALKADPTKNPMLARHGNMIEARNQAHGDRNSAYRALTSSNEYKAADPIQQMEMDDNFEKDWQSKNPQHLKNAMASHDAAHAKGKDYGGGVGEKGQGVFNANKDSNIKNIISGGSGHGGEGYSLEEGMQHAGGTKGEEGTQATVKQDPATSFAMGNQDFINQYGKDYADKMKNRKMASIDDMKNYDEGSKRDISRILGEGPNKDPKFEKFFAHYHPLIGMNAKKTLARLGIDPNHPEVDNSMLHEAGMHGLIQAMNDYDHDNPSKASFATHAANKIRGLQMTAMKNQDAIPTEVRQAQKKFSAGNAGPQPAAPKVDLKQVISSHPKAPDISDRLARVGAARGAVKIRKQGANKPPTGGSGTGGGI